MSRLNWKRIKSLENKVFKASVDLGDLKITLEVEAKRNDYFVVVLAINGSFVDQLIIEKAYPLLEAEVWLEQKLSLIKLDLDKLLTS